MLTKEKKQLLINELNGLSHAAQLFGNYTFQRKDVGSEVKIPTGKISKYMNDRNRKAPIEEAINFVDSLGLDLLATLKKYHGVVDVRSKTKRI